VREEGGEGSWTKDGRERKEGKVLDEDGGEVKEDEGGRRRVKEGRKGCHVAREVGKVQQRSGEGRRELERRRKERRRSGREGGGEKIQTLIKLKLGSAPNFSKTSMMSSRRASSISLSGVTLRPVLIA
jgi:hypothetical protein